jgi:uncharacterized protein (TIGR03437 family)
MSLSSANPVGRRICVAFAALLAVGWAHAQNTSLTLASGSAVKGGVLSLNLSLSAAASAPAGLEWTLSYPASDVVSLSMAAGPALSAAGKTLNCSSAVGAVTCLAAGANANTIASGIVAVATATLSSSSNSTMDSVPISNLLGTLPDGTFLGVSGAGGVISVGSTVSGLQCTPASVSSGGTANCTVTISPPAPSGGASVGLSSSNTAAFTVPASVVVSANATTASFTATAKTVTSNQSSTLTASLNGVAQAFGLTVTPPAATVTVTSLQCAPATVSSAGTSTCTVTLSAAAPSGGASVGLSSSNTAAVTVPTAVTVSANATTGSFTATAKTVTSNQSSILTASLNGGSATSSLTVTPPAVTVTVTRLQCAPATVSSAGTSTCTVTLSAAAPSGGASVGLSSSNTAAVTVPASVTVSANATTGSFTAMAKTVTSNQSSTLTASLNGGSATASLTVTPLSTAVTLTSLQCTPTTIRSGGSSTCTVTLSQAAPAGGSAITLSDNSSYLAEPGSVTAAAGASTGSFTATASTVRSTQTVTITALLNGSSKTTTVTISRFRSRSTSTSGSGLSAMACSPRVLPAGGQTTCTLQLSAAANPGQIPIVSSSDQVKTPATVLPRANQGQLTFEVRADAAARQQEVTISATADSGSVQDTIQVASGAAPVLSVPDRQMGKPGTAVQFQVTGADASNQAVQLAASDLPQGASFDPVSGDFAWTPGASQLGKYAVQFVATDAAGHSASRQVPIDVTLGVPEVEAVAHECSPGAIGELVGSWLAASDSSSGGTKVTVNGVSVPVLSASVGAVRFLCPTLDPGASLAVAVETPSGVSSPSTIAMQSASPWIFSRSDSMQAQGAVSFAGTSELAMMRNPDVVAHPAQASDEIEIWGTGFGPASEGKPWTGSVEIGGVDAQVESVRPAPGRAGVYTIRVRVPAAVPVGEQVPIAVHVVGSDGKQYDSNHVAIAVEPANQ